uniref:Uncharacterized protein n=1 Tax=Romanomermis culicivorax TaxID=13658 RepID=A0A915IY24_ROMCU
MKIQCLRAM